MGFKVLDVEHRYPWPLRTGYFVGGPLDGRWVSPRASEVRAVDTATGIEYRYHADGEVWRAEP